MKKEIIGLRFDFEETLLGSASGNPEIHEQFIASKAPTTAETAEEVAAVSDETVEEMIQKHSTIFPKDETGLFIWNYQMRGCFKENLHALITLGDISHVSAWSYKTAVDQYIMVNPRRIYLHAPDGTIIQEPSGTLQRSMRVDTLQGPRVALARSETVPGGTWIQFQVSMFLPTVGPRMKKDGTPRKAPPLFLRQNLMDAIEFASEQGFLQWRTGGYGRFRYTETTESKAAAA